MPNAGRAAAIAGLVWIAAGGGEAEAQECGGLIEAACLQSLGAGSTPLAGSDCGRQLAAYRECLAGAAAAAGPVSGAGSASCAEATVARLWPQTQAANDCLAYEGFRTACPGTPEARFAEAAMRRLDCDGSAEAAPTPPAQADRAAAQEAEDAAGAERETQAALRRAIQTELKRLGDYHSGIDGVWGGGSEAALRAFQRRAGLAVDGAPTEAALASLRASEPPQRAEPPAVGLERLRIGISGGVSPVQRLRDAECVRSRLGRALGAPVTLDALSGVEAVVEGALNGSLDLTMFSALSYARVHLKNPAAIEPVLVRVDPKGAFGYYSVMVARKDSGVRSLADMKGKTLALPTENSLAGHLIPEIEIAQAGYSMEKGAYFSDILFTGGNERTLVGVYSGDGADAGVTWSGGIGAWEEGYDAGPLRLAASSGLIDMTALREIWRSTLIPRGPVVLRQGLPNHAKKTVTRVLSALPHDDPECAEGFLGAPVTKLIPIDHQAYENLVEASRRAAQR